MAGYPDFGGVQALADSLGNLGLATQNLQASADQIAASLQAAGVPPYTPGLQSADIHNQPITSGVAILGPTANAIRLWGVGLSMAMAAASGYTASSAAFGYARVVTQLGGLTLAEVQLAVSAAGDAVNSSVTLPLNGIELAAGETVEIDVNNGTGDAEVQYRGSANILYTDIPAPVTPPPSPGAGLVGAYVKPSAWGSGTTIAQAETYWASITARPVTTRRIYWFASTGANAIPSAITGPGNYAGNGQTADAANGVRNYIDFTPAYNPVSAADLAAIDTYLASCKNAGLEADVSLWHEPYAAGLTAAQFIAMFEYYAPTVRKYYPACFNMEAYNAQQNGESGYFPGIAYCDKVYVDFYASEYFDAQNIRLDTAQAVADTNGLPFGLGEFNGSTDHQTDAQLDTFFSYVQTFMSARIAASKANADMILFNDNLAQESPYILSSGDYRVAKYQAIFDALNGA